MVGTTGNKPDWATAADLMQRRAWDSATALTTGFPHWANAETGQWTTTPDGDWTGGAFPGILWLAFHRTRDETIHTLARDWAVKLRPRAKLETAFKGFGFYYGAALGEMLAADEVAAQVAMEAAESLVSQFDPALGLIPLGKDAEEHGEVGRAFSSIDSLQASPLLFWAGKKTGKTAYEDAARAHTTRVLDIHCRPDGSIIQSSELDSRSGATVRTFTHKGFNDTSVWGRAQGWGMLYSVMAFIQQPAETRWLKQSMAAADWWLAHVPESMIAFWDFNDPAIPDTDSDTAATAMVCAAMLKLAEVAPTADARKRYRDAAERTAHALIAGYLTPTGSGDRRLPGMLIGGCFNKRRESRPQDYVTNAELIFGSYFLFESLQVLGGVVEATKI
jgi:unsaturated chondroitin disaccharide hydrolase